MSHNLRNFIMLHTRVTEHSSSLIDLFLTYISLNQVRAEVFACDLSDHLPIFIYMKGHVKNKLLQPAHPIQKIKETYLTIFRDKIAQTTWEIVLNSNDANDAYDEFLSILKPKYAASFPCVRIRKSRKIRKAWVNSELLASIGKKNELYSQFNKTKDQEILRKFRTCRNRLDSR
ncbi:unnamed protein product [Ixodes pacificus]